MSVLYNLDWVLSKSAEKFQLYKFFLDVVILYWDKQPPAIRNSWEQQLQEMVEVERAVINEPVHLTTIEWLRVKLVVNLKLLQFLQKRMAFKLEGPIVQNFYLLVREPHHLFECSYRDNFSRVHILSSLTPYNIALISFGCFELIITTSLFQVCARENSLNYNTTQSIIPVEVI